MRRFGRRLTAAFLALLVLGTGVWAGEFDLPRWDGNTYMFLPDGFPQEGGNTGIDAYFTEHYDEWIFTDVFWPSGEPYDSGAVKWHVRHQQMTYGPLTYQEWVEQYGLHPPIPPDRTGPDAVQPAEPTQSESPAPSPEPTPTPSPEPEKPKADKSKLSALYQQILDATGGRQGEYTDATWQQLVAASQLTIRVLEDDDALQPAVDTAYRSLSSAWSNRKKLDRTALKKVIDELSFRHKHQGPYSDESWQRFQTALESGQAAYEREKITQNELDKAKNELVSAEKALQPVDRSQLTALCALAEYVLRAAGETNVIATPQYTTESIRALRAALTPAVETAADLDNHSQKKVDDAWDALASVYFSLRSNRDAKYNWQDKEFLGRMLEALLQHKQTGRPMAGTPDPAVAKVTDAVKKMYPGLGVICDVAKAGSGDAVKDPMGVDERTYDILQILGGYTGFPGAGEQMIQTGRNIEFFGTRAIRDQLAQMAGVYDLDQRLQNINGGGNYYYPGHES